MVLVEDVIRPGDWNLIVRKYSPSRWQYTLANPEGGSFTTTAYKSAESAIAVATRHVERVGDKVWTIRAVWDYSVGDDGDYVVTGTGWTDMATGKTQWETGTGSGRRASESDTDRDAIVAALAADYGTSRVPGEPRVRAGSSDDVLKQWISWVDPNADHDAIEELSTDELWDVIGQIVEYNR